jgi:hypothetical protein
MGLAYSDAPIIYRTGLRCDTSAHLLADLDDALVAAGWTRTTVTDGFMYSVESPQGLRAKLKITAVGDSFAFPFGAFQKLRLQAFQFDGLSNGQVHYLGAGAPFTSDGGYEVVAGKCQLFLAVVGLSGKTSHQPAYAFSFGIPYVPQATGTCAAVTGGATGVTSIWWCESTLLGTFCFRSSLWSEMTHDRCLNGVIFSKDDTNPRLDRTNGTLQLYPMTPTYNADFWFYIFPQTVRHTTKDTIYLHPWIGWDFKVLGLVWDAFLSTKVLETDDVDDVITTSEADSANGFRVGRWLGWSFGWPGEGKGGGMTYYARLYLLATEPYSRRPLNIAY